MATSANLALSARRNEACVRTLRLIGRDLTNAAMRMQVRLSRDTPGTPLIDLATVADATAEGLHFVKVETINYLPVSTVTLTLSKATMSDGNKVPYMGEVGDNGVYSYGIQIDGVTRLEGSFLALASAIDSDNAPTNRPVTYTSGSAGGEPWSGATLTFTNDDVTVSIDGYAQLAPLVAGVAADRQVVAALRQQTATDSATASAGALAAINARDAALGAGATAGSAADRATAASTATAKDVLTTGQNATTSATLLAQVQALVAQQNVRYFVDATTGSDANDGLTAATSLKTGVSLTALGAGIAGKPVGLARGGRSRTMLSLTADNVRIQGYGDPSLAAPRIDCSIDLPVWTAVAGQPGYWTAPATLFADTKNAGNVFRNGEAVPLYYTVGETAANDYAASVSTWQQNASGAYQSGTNAVVTIHSVTNPNTDGSFWSIANSAGIHVTGKNAVIDGIQVDRAAHQDGGIAVYGEGATIRHCIVTRTSRHAVFAGADLSLEYCDVGRGSHNYLEGSDEDALVVFQASMAGRSFRTLGNVFWKGIIAHSSTDGEAPLGTVTHTDDTFMETCLTCIIGFSSDHQIYRPKFQNAKTFFGGGSTQARVRVTGATGRLNRMCDLATAEQFASTGAVVTVPLLTDGLFAARQATGSPIISSLGETYTIESGSGIVVCPFNQNAGSLNVQGTTINSPNGRALGAATLLMMRLGFDRAVTLTGGKNVWPFGSSFTINGTTYPTLAAAQAAGFEVGSTTTPLNAPTYTDTFDRADQDLETAGSGWTVLASDGVAGTAAVRNKALSVVKAGARTAYCGGTAASTDGYLRFTLLTADCGQDIVAFAISDFANFLGLMMTGGQYTLFGNAAGQGQNIARGTIAPAAGDDVVIERHGTRIRVYVNGAVAIDTDANNPAWNTERRFGLVSQQGIYPVLDNLRVGSL